MGLVQRCFAYLGGSREPGSEQGGRAQQGEAHKAAWVLGRAGLQTPSCWQELCLQHSCR